MLTYGYDAASHNTSLSATVDGTADFVNMSTYDALGRVTTLTQTDGNPIDSTFIAAKRVDLTYTDRGPYDTITRYADDMGMAVVATSTYTYDTAGRLMNLDHTSPFGSAGDLASYVWTFDAANRVTTFTSVDGIVTYSHDDTSQLTGADYDYQSDETFSYDANGNRTQYSYPSTGGSQVGVTTGTNNKTLSDGTYDHEYDAEGNRTKRTHIATGDVVEYNWNHANLLTLVVFKDSTGTVTKQVAYR